MKKRIFSLLLTVVMMVSLLPNAFAAKQPTFTDVSKDMWCFDNVEYVAGRGYFKGTTATTFNPNGTMTRQQFVTVLARMAGVKVDNSKTAFSDVPAGSYSAGSVAWAAKHGIVTGYADGTFHPTDPVTRQQMCAFMSRFMNYYANVHGAYFLKKGTVSGFADYDQVADYAKAAVDLCRTYGLIVGYAEDNTFRPTKSATRAHVAAVIYRLDQILRMAGGGGGGYDYTYTLTYTDTNADGNGYGTVTKETDATSYDFTVKGEPDYAVVDSNLVFMNWYEAATGTSYVENDTITATAQNPALTLDAAWTSPDDLLYIAMGESVNYANNQINTNQKLSDAQALLSPYATLDTLTMGLAPTDVNAPMANREVTLNAAATLGANVDDNLILTAAYYAYNLLGITDPNPADPAAVITKDEAKALIAGILDVLDPSMTWWEGATRTEKIKNLADKLYTALINEAWPHGSAVWNKFKYNNKPVITAVSVKDGSTTLLTVKNDKNLYDASNNVLTKKDAVKVVAKAMASKLYASLKANQTGAEFFYDLTLDGMLTLDFVLSTDTEIQAKAGQFATKYDTYAVVNLNQAEDILGYRYNGGNELQLVITELMQAEYADFVDAVAKEAMSKPQVKTMMLNMLTEKLEAFAVSAEAKDMRDALVALDKASNDADAAQYIKNILLTGSPKTPAEMWVEANLSTAENTLTSDGVVLPFDFFWNMGGTVKADGSLVIPTRAAAPTVLGNQGYLLSAVENEVADIMAEVIAKVNTEYGINITSIEDIDADVVEDLLDSKLAGKKADVNAELVAKVKSNSTAVTAIDLLGAGHKADLFLLTSGNIDDLTVEGVDNALNYPDDQCALCEYVRDILLTMNLDDEIDAAYTEFATTNAALISKLVPAGYEDEFQALIMNKLGFEKTYPAASYGDVLTAIAENIAAKVEEKTGGLDTASLEAKLNEAVVTAVASYSEYLNKVALVKELKTLAPVTVGALVEILENPAVLNMLDGKTAPAFVKTLANAIAKVESNTSTLTVNGKTVDMNDVKAVKTALKTGDAADICEAVAVFLSNFDALSINSFVAGVPVEATVNYKSYSVTGSAKLYVKFAD